MKKNIFILCLLGGLLLVSTPAFTQKNTNNDKAATRESGNTPSSKAAMAPASRTVVVEKLTLSNGETATRFPGTVQACRETRLAFRVGGPLIEMNINPGDQVKKGDVLMQIDPQDYRDRIRILEAQLSGARAQLDNARRDFGRMDQLFNEKVIPQADFDRAGTMKNTAHAQVSALQAQLITARHQLSYTTLKAPYNAIVTSTHIENFEMAAPGQTVAELHDISRLEIKINIPENEIAAHPLVADTPALVRFPAVGDQEFKAGLKEWSTSADRATRTYAVTFTMPHPPGAQVLPGMTAEINWPTAGAGRQRLTMPAKAVVFAGKGESHVWRFNPGTATASRVPVTLGNLYGASRIVVKSGLTQGDLIVTDGMDFITEGMKLTPTPAAVSANSSDGEALQ